MLREYLEGIQRLRGRRDIETVESFLLKHGKRFSISPLTPSQKNKFFTALEDLRPIYYKECFWNSLQLWMTDHDLKYCEGYAQFIIPVHHAWNTIGGKVVDITTQEGVLSRKARKTVGEILGKRGKQFQVSTPTRELAKEYFGVQFSNKECQKHLKIVVKESVALSMIPTKLYGVERAKLFW